DFSSNRSRRQQPRRSSARRVLDRRRTIFSGASPASPHGGPGAPAISRVYSSIACGVSPIARLYATCLLIIQVCLLGQTWVCGRLYSPPPAETRPERHCHYLRRDIAAAALLTYGRCLLRALCRRVAAPQ